MNKVCFKCTCSKPLSEFYKHPRMSSGTLNKCKECTKRDVKERRATNPDRLRAYEAQRSKTDKRIALSRTMGQRRRRQHPERQSARSKLMRAVASGKVVRWPVCAVHTCCAKPEAHHPDYGRPLDVVWLCSSHHKLAHHAATGTP